MVMEGTRMVPVGEPVRRAHHDWGFRHLLITATDQHEPRRLNPFQTLFPDQMGRVNPIGQTDCKTLVACVNRDVGTTFHLSQTCGL
jgi:hypothetical protein